MNNFFELDEFLRSDTALQKKIDNSPTFEVVEHLKELRELLNDLRQEWGSPINVTSGYRCYELNKAVGGSSTSVHRLGYAADLQPANGHMNDFKKFVTAWAMDKDFDQILLETNKITQWVHIGLYSNKKEQRHQIKILSV